MNLQQKLGLAIIKLRKEKGLSQEKFALEADVDRRYMSDLENGKRNPSLEIIEKIANRLEVSISELFLEVEKFAE